jgi:hypothetical protein
MQSSIAMKKIIRFIVAASALLALAGCVRDMDPFEGGDGVRANINGQKCVMLGDPGHKYASYSENPGGRFSAKFEMMHMLDRSEFHMEFKVSETSPLVTGVRYTVGSGENTAQLSYAFGNISGEAIPLAGWISFNKIGTDGATVEARFELEGVSADGREYSVRHGFMRLYKNAE